MRGLNPDRKPCVQGSIRSLGFNFTDWFAPFFSVRILTRKVASAEPLYYLALSGLFKSVFDNQNGRGARSAQAELVKAQTQGKSQLGARRRLNMVKKGAEERTKTFWFRNH